MAGQALSAPGKFLGPLVTGFHLCPSVCSVVVTLFFNGWPLAASTGWACSVPILHIVLGLQFHPPEAGLFGWTYVCPPFGVSAFRNLVPVAESRSKTATALSELLKWAAGKHCHTCNTPPMVY
jgi:hypothetical protein